MKYFHGLFLYLNYKIIDVSFVAHDGNMKIVAF